jgi:hypothetical protein
MVIWNILRSFGKIFQRFGMFCQEKSGNPGRNTELKRLSSRWKLVLSKCCRGGEK